MKNTLTIVVLIAVVITVGVLVKQKELVSLPQQEETPLGYQIRNLKEERVRLSVDAEYPVWSGFSDTAREALTTRTESLIEDQVTLFETTLLDMPEELLGSGQNTITIRFAPYTTTNDLISLLFFVETFTAGSAHPSSYALAFNYLPREGVFVELDDLLRDPEWLETISRRSMQLLETEFNKKGVTKDDTWLTRGAGPFENNFDTFLLGTENLTLYFDEYQVAPYAAGSFTINIPYSELEELWAEDAPIQFPLL